ncbi:hypothetical protein NIES593_18690 [Hydrococcus rivularis NIES-593]|uniref:Uncharacterized protein n=1 Tax=Hydrococcus rivularis NIES-593 TaxID=1921803 RepID=A0A1U7HA00_9CYAN|nr:hypothetical protein NIES593_18690 [Hydrococcus rivularis NIES-593]
MLSGAIAKRNILYQSAIGNSQFADAPPLRGSPRRLAIISSQLVNGSGDKACSSIICSVLF